MGTDPADGQTTATLPRAAAGVPVVLEETGGHQRRYLPIAEVGRGAMGRVVRAYDTKLEREVALKEVRRAGPESAEHVARLVAEARAMARLSHPNVVSVLDVDLLQSPYTGATKVVVVMEYVAGGSLKSWLTRTERPWLDILGRFVEAGRGLAAAHAVGLLHRDFKPANVVVDAGGRSRVTDFGLAKSIGAARSSGERSERDGTGDLTATGTVMGTPRYMSPEQHRAKELSTAADQFSFCVAVWEALCGRAPFTGRDLEEQKRRGPPAWPDGPTPKRIVAAIERGLSPLPSRRWPSMDALLDALEDDRAHIRARWWWAAAAAATLAVGYAAAQLPAGSQAERCSGAGEHLHGVWDDTRRTEVESAMLETRTPFTVATSERTTEQLDAYAKAWSTMRAEACEATAVRGVQSESDLDLRMSCLRRARMDLEAAVEVLASPDANVLRRVDGIVHQLPPVSRCADIDDLRGRIESPEPLEAEAVALTRARLAEAKAELAAGRYSRAGAAQDIAAQEIQGIGYEPIRAEVAMSEADVHLARGEYAEAEAAAKRAFAEAAKRRRLGLMVRASANLTIVVGHRQRRMAEGLRYAAIARGLARDPDSAAHVRNNLANIYKAQGRYELAEAEHREVLKLLETAYGPLDPAVAMPCNNLGTVLNAQGKYEEAEKLHRRALDLRLHAFGPSHPHVAMSRNNLGNVLISQKKYEEAERQHREALEIRTATMGAKHPNVAASHTNLANALQGQGKHDEAEAEQRRALRLFEETLGPDHPHVATVLNSLGSALYEQRRYEEAESQHRRALSIRTKALGPRHRDVAMSLCNLGSTLREQRKLEEAETTYRLAMSVSSDTVDPAHPRLADCRLGLAKVLRESGG